MQLRVALRQGIGKVTGAAWVLSGISRALLWIFAYCFWTKLAQQDFRKVHGRIWIHLEQVSAKTDHPGFIYFFFDFWIFWILHWKHSGPCRSLILHTGPKLFLPGSRLDTTGSQVGNNLVPGWIQIGASLDPASGIRCFWTNSRIPTRAPPIAHRVKIGRSGDPCCDVRSALASISYILQTHSEKQNACWPNLGPTWEPSWGPKF